MANTTKSDTDHLEPENGGIAIIGAGIIGCAVAYYLCNAGITQPEKIHLIEASTELFACASGRAGGFLASDWFGSATASLGELSFRLHRELAENNDGRRNWGYSRSTGSSFVQGNDTDSGDGQDWLSSGRSRAELAATHEFKSDATGPTWLKRRRGDRVDLIGADDTVAQVDPLRLSQFLLKECQVKGVHLHQPATAIKIRLRSKDSSICALDVREGNGEVSTLKCTRLLMTAGAWTPSVFSFLFPRADLQIPITQLAGHSLVVKSPRWTEEHETNGCHAIFTSMRSGFSPEIFSRIGGEIYIAGLNDSSLKLPATAADARIDRSSIGRMKSIAEQLLGQDGTDVSDLQVLREGLCFRPVTDRGDPILARIPDKRLGNEIATRPGPRGGVYIAAGHGPWGISHSLGTGKVMAELLEGQSLSADIRHLDLQ